MCECGQEVTMDMPIELAVCVCVCVCIYMHVCECVQCKLHAKAYKTKSQKTGTEYVCYQMDSVCRASI